MDGMSQLPGVRKVFVGSLPHGIQEPTLRATLELYGQVEDIFIKPNCEVGRQWAFVTFATAEQANHAKDSCDRQLQFPGAERPCDMMLAKNQGMFGQSAPGAPTPAPYTPPPTVYDGGGQGMNGPRKIFVGSLPDDITEDSLKVEFAKYGQVTDVFVKQNCESGRQWAFVSFSNGAEALHAKNSTDRVLTFPGSLKQCEVTLAKNQGMQGQDPLHGGRGAAPASFLNGGYAPPPAVMDGPRKVFVGSLPDDIQESQIWEEFQKYGQIQDVYVKTGCEPGRQWGFVTYANADQAQGAKNATDRRLVFPGADRPCEVTLAKHQGKFGQDPVTGGAAVAAVVPMPCGQAFPPMGTGAQPPPPTAPPPAHLTPWRTYYTAAGLPYYHNHTTGATQWEAPPDLSAPGASPYAQAALTAGAGMRYSPY